MLRRKPLWHKLVYFTTASLGLIVLGNVIFMLFIYTPPSLPSIHESRIYADEYSNYTILSFEHTLADFDHPLNGTLGIPRTSALTPSPIVFILPGPYLHQTKNEERVDQGFNYLVSALADNGYFALAIDLPSSYFLGYSDSVQEELLSQIFNLHLEQLQLAILGDDTIYNYDLLDQVDLSGSILLTQGAQYQHLDTLVTNASDYIDTFELIGNLLIAPRYSIRHTPTFIDVPTSILLPELDGEVVRLDGQTIFEELYDSDDFTSEACLVLLHGANHNNFNNAIAFDDTKSPYGYSQTILDAEKQQDFLIQYTLDFLNYTFDILPYSSLFDHSTPIPTSLYGYDTLISILSTDSLSVLSPNPLTIPYYNNLGGAITLKDSSLTSITKSYITSQDSSDGFNPPGTFIDLGLLRFNWTKPSSYLTTYIPPSYADVSDYSCIRFRIATDASHSLNTRNTPQSFTLELRDQSGARQRIIIPSTTPSLYFANGTLENSHSSVAWSSFTPVSDLRIPLSYFDDIDLTELYSLSLILNQTSSGSIIIQDLSFIK